MPGDAPSLLCVAPSWLGDAILALPAVEFLGRAGVHVEVLARAPLGRVFADAHGVARVHATSGTSRALRLRHAWGLRQRRFDAALVLAPSFAAALAARLAAARVRVGEAGEGRALWLTQAAPPAGRAVHLALGYQRLAHLVLAALDLPLPAPARRDGERADLPLGLESAPSLRARAAELAAARTLLRQLGISGQPPPLVIAPGARYGPAKRYPPASFARAAARLAATWDTAVLLVGENADAGATAALRAHLPAAHDLAGRTRLDELIGLLAGAGGVLANDSGTMHLAAALGRPTVGVFGSTNPLWTRPLGPRAAFVVHPVPCAPCYASTCALDFACMLALEPERLVATLQATAGDGETRSPAAGSGL